MNNNIKINPVKKHKSLYIIKLSLYAFISFLLSILTILSFYQNSYANTKNIPAPKFQNKYSTIYIGKSYKYTVINSPKNTMIKFTTNNKKLAKLNSKTGLLIPKKKGSLTLKATLKNTNKKTITLTKKITIKKKIQARNNEEIFYPSAHINSVNFTVRFKCNRIMQQSQVENSYISLCKDTHIAKGNFKNLSDDGRYITYELNTSSIKLLSPGDSSMNGTYELACTLSEKKYNIDYIEHMLGQSVTGFVLDKSGNAIPDASISLTDNNITVSTKSDKNGYYIVRFPKAANVNMSVALKDYITKNIDNISLKLTKSICKNIVLNHENPDSSSASVLTAFFKICDDSSNSKKIEIIPVDSDTPDKTKTYFTDSDGRLLITGNNNINLSSTEADIVNISDSINTISHADMINLNNNKNEIFNFSYDQDYYIKIYSDHNGSYLLKTEFRFSFNDFVSDNIIFNISLPAIDKTYFPESLLPITVGSNISYDKINYYHASLYRIGTVLPVCSFSFYENTPADFKSQIGKMNLYLNDGNIYYAIFKIYNEDNKEISPSVLYRFKIINSKICFENSEIKFNNTFIADNRLVNLPAYKNTVINVSSFLQDTTYLNTVLCSYDNNGDISKITFTSLSSQLLQYELLNSGNSYFIYTNNSTFSLQ